MLYTLYGSGGQKYWVDMSTSYKKVSGCRPSQTTPAFNWKLACTVFI